MSAPEAHLPLADAKFPLFVGIDLGGTNIKLGLVDDCGRTIEYHSVPTNVEQGPDQAVERISSGVTHLLEEARVTKSDVVRIGLATPGPMDLDAGLLLTPGNLPGWWDFPIRERVAAKCGLPVRFANDANAAAYGEYWQGAAADTHSMALLTLGTGIGGGVVIRDLLVEGAHSCGAECGFILIDPRPDARRDSLNLSGTLEAYCGSYGVVGRASDALAGGRESTLSETLGSTDPLTPLAIAQAAEAGDSLALEIVLDTARYLALGIGTLIHIVDPECVVLGGAMNFGGAGHPLGEQFLQKVRDELRPRLLPPLRELLQVEFAKLGGDAGYIGAAGLARLENLKQCDVLVP